MKNSPIFVGFSAALALTFLGPGCGGAGPETGTNDAAPARGGRLVATTRSEPANFDRLVSARAAEGLFTALTQAALVRTNPVTGELEPRLAEHWTSSPDGLTWTLKLRQNVQFSDGAPFTSADVLFTFEALYDKRVASGIADVFMVDGQPFGVKATDDHTVVVTFPKPYGPALATLGDLPILPRHKLEPALKNGTFDKAWAVTTPPADVVGLGPFMLAEYVPGQRLRFTRNPHFWRQDAKGQPLPYLDEVVLLVIPDQNAEVLQLQSGAVDLTGGAVRPEDLASMRRLEASGSLKLMEVGVGVDPNILWFNLVPGAARVKDRPWLQRDEFRQAIAYAVDRRAIVDTVYLGAAEPIYGPITTGFGSWYVADLPKTDRDLVRARTLLATLRLADRDGDGILEDAAGKPARFSILTQKGNTALERTVSVLQEQLRQVGLAVDVVTLDQGSVISQWSKADYDAICFYVFSGATDPARNLEIWMSSGSFHFWNPGQKQPATPWEARIDDLMRKQVSTTSGSERHRLFADVQRTLAEHLPLMYFAAPRITVAANARVRGAQPAVLQPFVLWNAETLSVDPAVRVPR